MKKAPWLLFGLLLAACAPPEADEPELPRDVLDLPITGFASSRPGWTTVDYPPAHRDRGPSLVTDLMAYLRVEHADDHEPFFEEADRREALLMLTAQLAADLGSREAVPFLVQELEVLVPDEDTLVGMCLIANLVDLTAIDGGERYHRRWFDDSVQTKALADLKQWMRENGF
ncbi:MAG: hypothetical protein ACYTG6_16170 [Planctomycetota bacterium]|jgi:hypothetical protein